MPSLSTPISSTQCFYFYLLLFAVVSHTQLKFNVQFNVLYIYYKYTTGYTYIQVYNFLNPTQLLSALIYSSKEYSLFENFS